MKNNIPDYQNNSKIKLKFVFARKNVCLPPPVPQTVDKGKFFILVTNKIKLQ